MKTRKILLELQNKMLAYKLNAMDMLLKPNNKIDTFRSYYEGKRDSFNFVYNEIQKILNEEKKRTPTAEEGE